MPIQIEVNETHAKLLVDFYVQRLKVLRSEILERDKETKEINTIIQTLRKVEKSEKSEQPEQSSIFALGASYSAKWPWVKKIKFALEQSGMPLTTKEIVDALSLYEADLLVDRKRAVASISSLLSSKSGTGKDFRRVDNESGDFAYTLNNDTEKEKEDDEAETENKGADDIF